MAIYDRDAVAATAVAAFLAQFTVSANGNIRYSSGSDTFHVWWLHRALQKIAWDFAISGDDEINLSKPNPSTSEALGTIITLVDHTTGYGVNYNITDTEAEYLFGGSVSQNNGDDVYGGLNVIGSVNRATNLEIIQNNTLLTSHWGTGKNQTDASTLLRIIVKFRSGGSDIDGGRIIVKSNTWLDSYAIWRTTLGLGESIASIVTQDDPQNTNLEATVGAYVGITDQSEGYNLIDIQDGNGPQPYLSNWTYGAYNKKALYEYVKYVLRYGTSETIFGVDGSLFWGPTHEITVSTGSGTWGTPEHEQITWTGGEGRLLAVDNKTGSSTTKMWIMLQTGVAPTNTQVITGTTSGATATASGTATALTASPNFLGTFTGTNWIGAFGAGIDKDELTANDTLTDLDGDINTAPNTVSVIVSTNGAVDPHVFLARDDGSGYVDYTEYTAASGNNSGNGTFVINESISNDTPQTGYIGVLATGQPTYEFLEYTSWSGSTFTLAGTLPRTYTLNDPVFIPFLYDSAVGGSDPRVASTSLIQSVPIDVVGWVRHGDPSSPDKPVPLSGTIGAAGFNVTVQLEDET